MSPHEVVARRRIEPAHKGGFYAHAVAFPSVSVLAVGAIVYRALGQHPAAETFREHLLWGWAVATLAWGVLAWRMWREDRKRLNRGKK